MFGVELSPVDVRDVGEIERAVTAFAHSGNGDLIVPGSPAATRHRELIIALAGPASIARGLQLALLRHRRWSDLLRGRFDRYVPAGGRPAPGALDEAEGRRRGQVGRGVDRALLVEAVRVGIGRRPGVDEGIEALAQRAAGYGVASVGYAAMDSRDRFLKAPKD